MDDDENETMDEKFARVRAMAEDECGDTWDLSDNDRAALLTLLVFAEIARGAR